MYDQKYPFFNQMFTKSEFCKDFNAGQYLTYMIEKWWKFLANGSSDSALSLNGSYHFKAFDCIDHHLLIGKLNPYDVDTNSLYF